LRRKNGSKRKSYGSSKVLDGNYEKVIRDIRRVCREEATIEEIAEKWGVSRATFFNWLKKKGLSVTQICEEMKKELEEKEERRIKKKDIKKVPPKDFDEFMEFETVKKVYESMRINNLSESHINRTLRIWFKLCVFACKHPDYITQDDVHKFLVKMKEEGKDLRNVISTLQTIQKWQGRKILPSGIEQKEYKGKYTTCELMPEVRRIFLQYAKEMFPKYYDLIEAVAKFLFYTGSRREALKTFSVAGEVKINIPEYDTNEFIMVKTIEKGQKGEKRERLKIIPKHEFKLKHPLSEGEVKKVENMFNKILQRILREHKDKLNKDTIEYIKLGRALHIWRHTACRSALKAFKWHRLMVARLLGWDKPDNLQIYGDFGLMEMLREYIKEPPKFKF